MDQMAAHGNRMRTAGGRRRYRLRPPIRRRHRADRDHRHGLPVSRRRRPGGLLDLVLTGRQAFRRLPPCRVDLADYYSADRAAPDATYSARAAVLEGWRFDLEAFGVPEAVYQATDPAHWLALETTARRAGRRGFPLGQGLARSRTGVIIGNTLTGDSSRAAALRLRWPYVRRVMAEALAAGNIPRERAIPVLRHAAQRYMAPFPAATDETLAGSTPAAIASRICGYFGFRGGGYAVDGSQASSLLAVASACTSLAAGDLDVAIAGGVDISLDPLELVGLAKTGALARGDMRVYDENPTGFLPGEGCGMVVLMRSADARLTGLPVYAEIAGWGPRRRARPAWPSRTPTASSWPCTGPTSVPGSRRADVQLIEGHGAGTAAADTTELSALAELRAGAKQVAALGSIKANIGNAMAAAGAAGLIKTVLAMSTGSFPRRPGSPGRTAAARRTGRASGAARTRAMAGRDPGSPGSARWARASTFTSCCAASPPAAATSASPAAVRRSQAAAPRPAWPWALRPGAMPTC